MAGRQGQAQHSKRLVNLATYGEIIRELYVHQRWSQGAIGELLGVRAGTIGRWMQALGIPVRTQHEWHSGENHPRYKDGSAMSPYRAMVKREACTRCGSTTQLVIHHKDGDHYNNVLENLEVLCRACHCRLHKQEWWDGQPKQTHCLRGHELTEDNVYINSHGHRSCKTCKHLRHRLSYQPAIPKSYCVHGHDLIGSNVYVNRRGHRSCRICRADAARRRQDRKEKNASE